jgi:hypothetical protein
MCDRDMRLATFKQKGMTYVSQLALENVKALKAIIQWNHEHGVRFFRCHEPDCPVFFAYKHLCVHTEPGFSWRNITFLFPTLTRPGCLTVRVSDAQARVTQEDRLRTVAVSIL